MVAHCPNANAPAVADSALMLLMATTRHLLQADRFVREWRCVAITQRCAGRRRQGRPPRPFRPGNGSRPPATPEIARLGPGKVDADIFSVRCHSGAMDTTRRFMVDYYAAKNAGT